MIGPSLWILHTLAKSDDDAVDFPAHENSAWDSYSICGQLKFADALFAFSQNPHVSAISANTSLEKVSDWITKTIVGVGLVSWAGLFRNLDRAGGELGLALFGPGSLALPGGVIILVGLSGLSALAAYLWFSRYLPSEFDDAFRNLNQNPQGTSQQPTNVAPATPTLSFAPVPDAGDRDGTAEDPPAERKLVEAVATKYARMRRAPLHLDDWAKGMFGGTVGRHK